MAHSLNLSPARGPSTWARMERESQRDKFGMTLIGVGLSGRRRLLRPWRGPAGITRRKAPDDGVTERRPTRFSKRSTIYSGGRSNTREGKCLTIFAR